VVIDNGTGYGRISAQPQDQGALTIYLHLLFSYTKMGYSGNNDPQYIIPTCIATSTSKVTRGRIDDLDYFIGDEAMVRLLSFKMMFGI
jgi:hypothetical protein